MSKKSPKKFNKIKELEDQITELKSGWQRTQADFENFRNRTAQERLELIKTANTDLVLAILPVLNNFERALTHKSFLLRHSEQSDEGSQRDSSTPLHSARNDKEKVELQKIRDYIKGLELIKTQLEQILAQEGLNKIEVKPGDQFDPNLHEAISTEKSNQFKQGQIIEVVENGYKFGDKVLKPVKVKVAK